MSTIKIKRARALSTIGACPGSFDAMLAHVPGDVREALTSAQLAHMIDGLWRACGASKAIATQDACAEGAIWDAQSCRMREIAA